MLLQRIDIKTDYICNNNCLFCVVGEDERNCKGIPLGIIKDELADARNNGATEVALTGGEPTIRKEITQIIEYAKAAGFKTIMVITNGRMLSDRKFARKIVDAGANKFMFSIHGLEEAHDALTRVTGSFKQAVQGMRNIRELGKDVITDTVATKLNYKELPAIIDFLINFGSSVCQIDFVIPSGNAWKYKEKVIPKFTDCVPYIHKTIDHAKKKGEDKKVIVMGVPYCFMKGYETYMNEPKIPQIKITSPHEQHKTDDYNMHRVEGKIKPDSCTKCEHFGKCEGVWENYIKLHGDSEILP
jgi:MoaA/NifB/PqqE/SkfB family radical SAM enzyme